MITEPILYALGGLVFGYLISSNNSGKDILSTIDTFLTQNQQFGELSSSIEILNRDIDSKQEYLTELDGEIAERQESINRLIQRAEHLKNSGELQQLDDLYQKTQQLNHLKEILSKLNKKNEHKFNLGVLIAIVQELYEELHHKELDLIEVQYMIEEYLEHNDSSDTFGEQRQVMQPPKPKRTSSLRR